MVAQSVGFCAIQKIKLNKSYKNRGEEIVLQLQVFFSFVSLFIILCSSKRVAFTSSLQVLSQQTYATKTLV